MFALNLLGFPRRHLAAGLLEEIVRGGGTVAAEAGIAILGGHSIDAAEPLFGLCAIGEVHPDRIVTNGGARAGDRLVLTKPLGTGLVSTALKGGSAPPDATAAAVSSMTTLNRGAADAMGQVRTHAATDVSGYGLLGHLHQLLVQSRVAGRVRAGAVPLLPHARELAQAGHLAGGTRRNRDDLAGSAEFEEGVPEDLRVVLFDAQTSGGLLIAVDPADRDVLLAALRRARTPAAADIGEVVAGPAGHVRIGP